MAGGTEAVAATDCDQAAEAAISRIRGIVNAAARSVSASGTTEVGHIRCPVRRLEDTREVLDEDGLPHDKVEAVREGLKAREALGLIEAADLPLPRALDEVRLSQNPGPEGRRGAARTAARGGRAPLAVAGE